MKNNLANISTTKVQTKVVHTTVPIHRIHCNCTSVDSIAALEDFNLTEFVLFILT